MIKNIVQLEKQQNTLTPQQQIAENHQQIQTLHHYF